MNAADKKRLLREMLFARRFEERCYEAYVERKIGGFLHLYPGQEACAHGVLEAARPGQDYVITGYRDHVHAIKCGSDPKEVMAELFGKVLETRARRDLGEMIDHATDMAAQHEFAQAGDTIVMIAGVPFGTSGRTNLLHVATVPQK
mgnify:CR=1 FL=1